MDPGFSNMVDGRFPRTDEGDADLFGAAEAVERMLASQGWLVVQDLLATRMAGMDDALEGAPKEAAEYAKLLGERRAMRSGAQAAEALIGKAARRREDAERRAKESDEAARVSSERTGV